MVCISSKLPNCASEHNRYRPLSKVGFSPLQNETIIVADPAQCLRNATSTKPVTVVACPLAPAANVTANVTRI